MEKAITISMLKNSCMENNDGEQRMTSLEIAQLTGKQHNHLMRDIRKMETGWEKVTQSKFGLSTYQDSTGRKLPCYSLTKTECLYIATKFNDEARARLVIRWKQLEEERQEAMQWEWWKARYSQIERPQGLRLLGCSDEEVLDEADDIIGETLDELNSNSDHCYTPSDIGKVFGLEGRDLNSFLCDRGVIRWGKGQWELTRKFQDQGLAENRNFIYHGRDGHRRTQSRLVWTSKGRDFLMDMIRN